MQELKNKENNLVEYLQNLNKVAVAFSAGVDSTYLLKMAKKALGTQNVLAITIKSSVVPNRDITEAIEFCKSEEINHKIVEFNELDIEGFSKNPKDRCYICKKSLFTNMKKIALESGYELVEGSNMDDLSDYRPGMKAIAELNIKSPLKESNLYKEDIRKLSRIQNLKTWDKPSFACLASRFVYGEEINKEKLKRVELAEEYLLNLGIKQFRVRIHGEDLARIEVEPEQISILSQTDVREKILEYFKSIGFNFVALDLQGYKTGNMNTFIQK